MAAKRKAPVKKMKTPPVGASPADVVSEKPAKPQFVTEVVEEVPPNEGVDTVSDEALETIKADAEEIEDVVEDIQEKKEAQAAAPDEVGDGETEPVADVTPAVQKKEEEKEVLAEIFTKDSSPKMYPDISEHKRTGTSSVFLWAVIIIGVALLTGGTLLVVASGLPKLPAIFTKPTPTPTPSPTPTPTPATAARGDIKLQVLNGGGTPGSAGKAKSLLEEKGYTVADVGNTDEYTYKETEIHVKAEKEAYLTLLKEDLAQDYTIGTASADLPADSSYDAQIIVGKE